MEGGFIARLMAPFWADKRYARQFCKTEKEAEVSAAKSLTYNPEVSATARVLPKEAIKSKIHSEGRHSDCALVKRYVSNFWIWTLKVLNAEIMGCYRRPVASWVEWPPLRSRMFPFTFVLSGIGELRS